MLYYEFLLVHILSSVEPSLIMRRTRVETVTFSSTIHPQFLNFLVVLSEDSLTLRFFPIIKSIQRCNMISHTCTYRTDAHNFFLAYASLFVASFLAFASLYRFLHRNPSFLFFSIVIAPLDLSLSVNRRSSYACYHFTTAEKSF